MSTLPAAIAGCPALSQPDASAPAYSPSAVLVLAGSADVRCHCGHVLTTQHGPVVIAGKTYRACNAGTHAGDV